MSNVLRNHVLVLNKNWRAIATESVRDCVKGIFTNTRQFLDSESYSVLSLDNWLGLPLESTTHNGWINAGKTEGKQRLVIAPDIVILTDFGEVPKSTVRLVRKNILIRDRYCCQYCGIKVAYSTSEKKLKKTKEFTLDHVIPRGLGGKNSWNNLVTCCYQCNNKKAMRTPAQADMTLLSTPIKPSWSLPIAAVMSGRPKCWDQFLDKSVLDIGKEDHEAA